MAQLVKTVNGLAIASVKTVDGLTTASVKTINGLDNTSGGGSVTVANRANSGATTTSPITTAFTVTGVSPLLVSFSTEAALTVTSVTWNGGSEALSLIGSIADGVAATKTWLYGLKNPTAKTDNVVVTLSGNPSSLGAVVYIIGTTGGDTTTGWRSAFTRNDGTGTGPGLTVTDSVSGDVVFHACAVYTSTTIVFDAGETTTSTLSNNIFGGGLSAGMSTKPAVGANTTVGCTDVVFYDEVAVSVIPA